MKTQWLAIGCLVIAGCANVNLSGDTPGVLQNAGISVPDAQASIAAGRSTKAEVMARLGPATVVPFESGFEVWVYRWPGAQPSPRAATELVVLFEPSGIVKKTRVRPGYAEPQR